jgi:NAD(P)H dehydrogenase (quinone)
LIAGSGLQATILCNGWYTENWTASVGGAIAAGALIGAAGAARFTPAVRADCAQALAVAAADPAHAGKTCELAGDEAFALADLAAEVSRRTGKALPCTDLPPAVYAGILQGFGLPEGFVQLLVDVDQKAGEGWLTDDSGTLARLLGRPTTWLSEAVAAALSQP